ncbi:MAG TPA: Ku protein [Nitrososphaeraceae archaeon]|nr:Ku protein [Nitrososphaeraceae archaeon]
MAARDIWKGSISFGLVNIPIQVFSATQKEDYTSFSQLCDKGHKIKYKKWCPVEEREAPWSEIKKGYEITKNNYVVLEKQEIENIMLKTTNTIEVKEFIRSDEFDPIFIEKNYYVGPEHHKSKGQEIVPKQEEEPEETTDIIEALKASLQLKGKSSKSTAAKAKVKIAIV